MKFAIAMFAFGTVMLAAPAVAGGIGFTVGPPIEERMGSEYGAEYSDRDSRVAESQRHGRAIRVKTRTADHRRRQRR
jgi:hypothetical protein